MSLPTFIYVYPKDVEAFQRAALNATVEPVLEEMDQRLPPWMKFGSGELQEVGEHLCSWGRVSLRWALDNIPGVVENSPHNPANAPT